MDDDQKPEPQGKKVQRLIGWMAAIYGLAVLTIKALMVAYASIV